MLRNRSPSLILMQEKKTWESLEATKEVPKMVLVDPFQGFQSPHLTRTHCRMIGNLKGLTSPMFCFNHPHKNDLFLLRKGHYRTMPIRQISAKVGMTLDGQFPLQELKSFEVIIVLASSWQPYSCPSWSIPWGETERDLLQKNLEKTRHFFHSGKI